jgi:hypothetical protein
MVLAIRAIRALGSGFTNDLTSQHANRMTPVSCTPRSSTPVAANGGCSVRAGRRERAGRLLLSARQGYGSDRRILLLHGPVGSSKSTIVRLLKKGLEHYSRLDEGALYSFAWKGIGDANEAEVATCPMHEEPLKLIPRRARRDILAKLNADLRNAERWTHLTPLPQGVQNCCFDIKASAAVMARSCGLVRRRKTAWARPVPAKRENRIPPS